MSAAEVDRFAALTGDVSPLHMDDAFARARGFRGRVVHGLLVAGLLSRIFGVRLPGRDCILHAINLKWLAPAYVDDVLRLTATVGHISYEARAMTVDVLVENVATGGILARGKVQVGFTE